MKLFKSTGPNIAAFHFISYSLLLFLWLRSSKYDEEYFKFPKFFLLGNHECLVSLIYYA